MKENEEDVTTTITDTAINITITDALREKERAKTWIHRPLLLVNALKRANEEEEELPMNSASEGIEVNNEMFKGKIFVRCKDVKSRDGDLRGKELTEKYFLNKKRTFQTVIQGQFMKPGLKCSNVFIGHKFEGKVRKMPARWLVRAVLKVLCNLIPGLVCDILVQKPKALTPLCATAQFLRADIRGEEPDCLNGFSENTRLFGEAFIGGERGNSIPSKQRKRMFANPEFSSQYEFSTDLVYSFDFYNHIFCPATFCLRIAPMININLLEHLPEFEAPQIMAIDMESQKYLYNIKIFHENMFR